jgi:PAS domain S-box-containing protein
MNKSETDETSHRELLGRLVELEAVIAALRDHQVDAIVGDTDVALVHLRQVEEALRESAERYRAFVANSSEGIWRYEIEPPMPISLDADAQIDYILTHGYLAECNDALARMVGSDHAADLIGRRADSSAMAASLDTVRDFIASGYRLEQIEIRRPDRFGNDRWLAVSVLGMPHEGKLSRLWGVQRDITERRRAEENVRQRTTELTALLAVTRVLASTLDLAPLLDRVLAQLRTVIDFSGAYIGMLQGDTGVAIAYDGPAPRGEVVGRAMPVELLNSHGDALDAPMPLIVEDNCLSELLNGDARDAIAVGIPGLSMTSRSWLFVPLKVKDAAFGLLALDHPDPRHFTTWHAHLAQAFADHAALAIENARLYRQAGLVAAMSERQRLAAELHDSVTQSIYGISLAAHTAIPLVEDRPERVRSILTHILGLADAAFADVRSLIFELRPEALERHGLVSAIERRAQPLRVREQITLHLDLGAEPAFPLDVKEAIYRIAQESFTNISKHARAREVWVKLESADSALSLEVRDDGKGFDPTLDYGGHLGLQVMKERAARFGGTLTIESRLGAGATIRARVPVL